MNLKLVRTDFRDDGIFGELWIEQGKKIATTLEHSYDREPKVPAGNYICRRGNYALHSGPIETFEVCDVPGHTGILFHRGNFNRDSEGCICLGEEEVDEGDGTMMITCTPKVFNAFMELQEGVDEFQLEVC